MSHILFENTNLYYSSLGYKERSLKVLLGNIFSQKKNPMIDDIHALKDISINIKNGDRVGLLGHNGAGKSTFLKAIAGIYPIQSGLLDVQGHVRSLFDISLGFEPDASGRENILFRGLLLGLTPKQVREKEEEIIAFSGLGDSIEYPIKTYSAGMQVRLAFSISTALSGDILLLDEVIGAGDASFMKKAKKRISNLMDSAKIVILASHDDSALEGACERGLVFHRGCLVFDGDIMSAVKENKKVNGIQ